MPGRAQQLRIIDRLELLKLTIRARQWGIGALSAPKMGSCRLARRNRIRKKGARHDGNFSKHFQGV